MEESLSFSQPPELTVFAVITNSALPGPALCSTSACQGSGAALKLESFNAKKKEEGEKAFVKTRVFDDDDDVINVNNSHASTAESSAGRAECCQRRCELRTSYSTSEACLILTLDLMFSRHES